MTGFTFGFVAYDLRLRRERQSDLRQLLLKIGRKLYKDSNSFEIINSHYDEIFDICTSYNKCIYTNLRNLLVESWDFLPIFHDGTSTK